MQGTVYHVSAKVCLCSVGIAHNEELAHDYRHHDMQITVFQLHEPRQRSCYVYIDVDNVSWLHLLQYMQAVHFSCLQVALKKRTLFMKLLLINNLFQLLLWQHIKINIY